MNNTYISDFNTDINFLSMILAINSNILFENLTFQQSNLGESAILSAKECNFTLKNSKFINLIASNTPFYFNKMKKTLILNSSFEVLNLCNFFVFLKRVSSPQR